MEEFEYATATSAEPEAETSQLELGALEVRSRNGSDPEIPDIGLHEETRKLAKKRFRRLLRMRRLG